MNDVEKFALKWFQNGSQANPLLMFEKRKERLNSSASCIVININKVDFKIVINVPIIGYFRSPEDTFYPLETLVLPFEWIIWWKLNYILEIFDQNMEGDGNIFWISMECVDLKTLQTITSAVENLIIPFSVVRKAHW